jgi:hypothetical protein
MNHRDAQRNIKIENTEKYINSTLCNSVLISVFLCGYYFYN